MKTFLAGRRFRCYSLPVFAHNHNLIPKTIVRPNTTSPCMRGTTAFPLLSYARLSSGNRTGEPVRSLAKSAKGLMQAYASHRSPIRRRGQLQYQPKHLGWSALSGPGPHAPFHNDLRLWQPATTRVRTSSPVAGCRITMPMSSRM